MENSQYDLFQRLDGDTKDELSSAEAEDKLIGAAEARSNGNLNKVRAEDSSIHDWYRFVLSFPPHLVRDYVSRFGLSSRHRVLDPFCGTGTTLVECKKLGIQSVGVEANPVAHFASRVKVNWSPAPNQLLTHAKRVAEAVTATLESDGLFELFELFGKPSNGRKFLTLDEAKNKLLLTNSISPLPLHKSLVLIEHLNRRRNSRFFDHERLALAKALVSSISNLHFGPEVGVGKPRSDAPVVSSWLQSIKAIADDLRVHGENSVKTEVHHADSRNLIHTLSAKSVDAVITSPPYPNEKDYTRTTRLESVLLGFINNKQDLRELKQGLVRSNTRNVYKADEDDLLVEDNQEIQRIATQIEKRRIDLGKTSGFERLYARTTKLYFGGMKRHLLDLRRVLRPGAQLAYVVGDQASYLRVMIRTAELLAGIAESVGYEVGGIDLFRTRLATATREQLREEVLLLRWPGTKSRV
jgi:hypothetical protein